MTIVAEPEDGTQLLDPKYATAVQRRVKSRCLHEGTQATTASHAKCNMVLGKEHGVDHAWMPPSRCRGKCHALGSHLCCDWEAYRASGRQQDTFRLCWNRSYERKARPGSIWYACSTAFAASCVRICGGRWGRVKSVQLQLLVAFDLDIDGATATV